MILNLHIRSDLAAPRHDLPAPNDDAHAHLLDRILLAGRGRGRPGGTAHLSSSYAGKS